MDVIRVGVIGLGFMGRTHVAAYAAADAAGHANRLVAVCDVDDERRAGLRGEAGNLEKDGASTRVFDPADVRAYARPAQLLADDAVELVSICTPTDSHVELGIAALEAGKHVLVEKPMALVYADVKRLADAARASERLCMPALCMRFWPAWTWLKATIDARTFGPVRSAMFQRLACPPTWSRRSAAAPGRPLHRRRLDPLRRVKPDFYGDPARSGGALVDLHVHDTDFVCFAFGAPESVVSTGDVDHLTTLYRYGAGGPPHVVAEGGWDHAPGFDFRMRFVVVFEGATADFELGRDPELVLCRGGARDAVPLDPLTGYDGEVRHLLDAITGRGGALLATMEDAELHARLLDAERESLERRLPVRVR